MIQKLTVSLRLKIGEKIMANKEFRNMLATGRIDLIAQTSRYIYVTELKLKNYGGKKAAILQIQENKYLEPFQADWRKAISLGIELDEEGKGLLDWGITEF